MRLTQHYTINCLSPNKITKTNIMVTCFGIGVHIVLCRIISICGRKILWLPDSSCAVYTAFNVSFCDHRFIKSNGAVISSVDKRFCKWLALKFG